jgi:alkaline phosphatase D
MKKILVLFTLLLCTTVSAQKDLLQSGPMLGYTDFREVLVWVQTTQPASVKIGYTLDDSVEQFTEKVQTTSAGDHIAKLYARPLEYGKTYDYVLYINDKAVPLDYALRFKSQALWQYRKDPPAMRIAIGSCNFINEERDDRPQPYGATYGIFQEILSKEPDAMLWLGDNTYLRTTDFTTETGIRHRYKHTRSTKEMQPLLASVHHYATWDDHDYGPNDSDRSYALKHLTEKAFNDYWGNSNTNVAGNGGITSHFALNDVEIFMLDDRYHRAPNAATDPNKEYLGAQQLNWLIDALTSSTAPFKIVMVGGQVISDAAVFENYATFSGERNALLTRIATERIEGVVFMSGDRHHTEISRLERPGAYPLVDITCSPLTAGTHSPRDEGNSLQVIGKTFYERNFGIIDITGPRTDRKMLLTIYDNTGTKVFDYELSARELKYKN